jgi:hypothetical protein
MLTADAAIALLLRRRNRFSGSAFPLDLRTPTRLFQIGFALRARVPEPTLNAHTAIFNGLVGNVTHRLSGREEYFLPLGRLQFSTKISRKTPILPRKFATQ